MDLTTIIQKLEQIQHRLEAYNPKSIRPACSVESLQGKRAVLVTGPRGVGKTTLLVASAQDSNVLYLSAENPIVSGVELYHLAEIAFEKGYEGLAIDEVHHSLGWSKNLKAIYDSYPNKKIWASDSSSLKLREGLADLSRRFPRIEIPFLSFREFIFFKEAVLFEKFNPLETKISSEIYSSKLNILALFNEYLSIGLRPIFLEGDYSEKLLNIIEKTIYTDIPFLLPSIQGQYLKLMNSVIGYLALSTVPTLNIDSLSREWSIGKEKLYELLNVLEHVGLINILHLKRDKKASGKGAKILLADPTMYRLLGGDTGTLREAFLVNAIRDVGMSIFAADNEKEGDFLIDEVLVEIGGKNKKRKLSDYVVRDGIEYSSHDVLPLWSFGFLI